jgi:hypothetical protein
LYFVHIHIFLTTTVTMKLSTLAALSASAASASAMSLSGKASQKVVNAARRVEQNAAVDYTFLANYTVKMIGCKSGLEEPIIDEEGNYEYEAVLLRLCPIESGCDSDSKYGCSSSYGEMMVGISTFIEAYFEDQRDNMNWDDNFQVDKYAECEEYKPEDRDTWENYQFFIGPTCTEDGSSIRLAVFEDEVCTVFSEFTFEAISEGWTLPFGDGGLVSTSCNDCMEYNDRGEYELRDMCMRPYENAVYKCEEGMEYYSYFGQNVEGCDAIESAFPMPKSSKSGGGKIFGWVVLAIVVVGLIGYVVWWRKKKSSSSVE